MRAISVFVGIAVALVAQRASADDLALTWRAPEGCPPASAVHEAAIRGAGDNHAPLDADALVTQEQPDRWSVTIRTKRAGVASADRRLDASSCAALADATAVILSLALVPPAPAPAPVPAPAPAPAPVPPPARAPAPDRSPSDLSAYAHPLAVSASVATDATTLPSPAVGGHAAIAFLPGRARIEVAGGYFAEQSQTTGTSLAGATFTLLSTGVRGCWAIVREDVELSPCAGADVQVMSARGFGAARNYDASAAWMSVSGGALLRIPLTSWVALRAQVDAIVPLSRPSFVVEGDGAVHRPAGLGARAGIGAELLFL